MKALEKASDIYEYDGKRTLIQFPIRIYSTLPTFKELTETYKFYLVSVNPSDPLDQKVLLWLPSSPHTPHNSHTTHITTNPSSSNPIIPPSSIYLDHIQSEPIQQSILFNSLMEAAYFICGSITHPKTFWSIKTRQKQQEDSSMVLSQSYSSQTPMSMSTSISNTASNTKQSRMKYTIVYQSVHAVWKDILRTSQEKANKMWSLLNQIQPHTQPSTQLTSSYDFLYTSHRHPQHYASVDITSLSPEQYTTQNLFKFFERKYRDHSIEPILKNIHKFRRYGPGKLFEFFCEWENGAFTWVRYVHLYANPHYREYLKSVGWDINIEQHLDLDVDSMYISEDEEQENQEYENYMKDELSMCEEKLTNLCSISTQRKKRKQPDSTSLSSFPSSSSSSSSSSNHNGGCGVVSRKKKMKIQSCNSLSIYPEKPMMASKMKPGRKKTNVFN